MGIAKRFRDIMFLIYSSVALVRWAKCLANITNVALPALTTGYESKLGICCVSKPQRTLTFASRPWQNIYGCHGQYSVLRILEKFHIDG